MYISVKYWKSEANGFAGNAYTYKTNIAFLQVGDKVAAPVKNRGTGAVEDKKAVVVDIGVAEPPFPCSTITKLWTEPEAEKKEDAP